MNFLFLKAYLKLDVIIYRINIVVLTNGHHPTAITADQPDRRCCTVAVEHHRCRTFWRKTAGYRFAFYTLISLSVHIRYTYTLHIHTRYLETYIYIYGYTYTYISSYTEIYKFTYTYIIYLHILITYTYILKHF